MTYRIALMLLMCVCIKAASSFFSSARWNCATFVINRDIHSSCACVHNSAKEVVDRKISEEVANWLAIELWIDSLITALFSVSEMDNDHSHHGHHNHGVEASSAMPTTNMQQVDPHAGHIHPMGEGESSTMNHAMHHMMSMAVSTRTFLWQILKAQIFLVPRRLRRDDSVRAVEDRRLLGTVLVYGRHLHPRRVLRRTQVLPRESVLAFLQLTAVSRCVCAWKNPNASGSW